MWLQNLILLGTVVCSISAPTHTPSPVTRPWQHVNAIKEALSLLNKSGGTDAAMVSEGGSKGHARATLLALTCPAYHLSNMNFPFLQNGTVKVISDMFDPQVRCFSLTHLPRGFCFAGVGGGGILDGPPQCCPLSLQSAGCQEGCSGGHWLCPEAVM